MYFFKFTLFVSLLLILNIIDKTIGEWQLNWSEEFNENTIDQDKWKIADGCSGGVFGEVNCYTKNETNIRQFNGTLVMTAKEQRDGNRKLTSSRITTWKLFSKGQLKIRAAMPKGRYLFGLAWLTQLDQNLLPRFHMITHRQINEFEDRIEMNGRNSSGRTSSQSNLNDFQVYSMEWNETQISFSSKSYSSTYYFFTPISESVKFVLDIILGVGGTVFNSPVVNKNISNDWYCPSLIIDYIKYYQWTDEPLNNTVETAAVNNVNASDICAEVNGLDYKIEPKRTWKLVWSDEFNEQSIDTNNWIAKNEQNICDGSNVFEEENCYTNNTSNIKQLNGTLVLVAKEESKFNKNFTSAWIETKNNFSHGKIEIRAAMPNANYLFAHLFMNPIGQISDQEQNVKNITLNFYKQTDSIENNIFDKSGSHKQITSIYEQVGFNYFHTYSIEWNDWQMIWKRDSDITHVFDTLGKFNLNQQFKLNMAVGIGGIPFGRPLLQNITNEWDCPALIIDYVRYYQLVLIRNETTVEEPVGPNRDHICSNLNSTV